MRFIKFIFLLFFLSTLLPALEIVDDGAVIKLQSGKKTVKQITVYNFSEQPEVYQVELQLTAYPQKEIAPQRVALAELMTEELAVAGLQKKFLAVNLNARRDLPCGEYVYTVILKKTGVAHSAANVKCQPVELWEIPLIIAVTN